MNDMITTTISMTSKEIADLTGKRHDNVLRDVDKTIESLSSHLRNGFKLGTYKDSNNIERRQYEMDRAATLCVIAGYNVELRMKIINRWEELEAQAKKVMSPLDILSMQVELLRSLENEQKALDSRQTHTEERLDNIETAQDHFTVIGYNSLVNGKGGLPLQTTARLGRIATAICKEHGIEMGTIPDPRFGTVKTYPKWVLQSVFEE